MLSENIKAVKAAEAEAAKMVADARAKAQELNEQAEKAAKAREQVEKETEDQIAALRKQADEAYSKAAEAVIGEII